MGSCNCRRVTPTSLLLDDVAITRRNGFNPQNVANMLWAYAVSNIDVPLQFNADFIGVCLKNENDFAFKHYTQLH
jgi:hypothetical protein